MENIIEFKIVSKSFGDLKVLNNLNLQVKDGEKLYHSSPLMPIKRDSTLLKSLEMLLS